MDACLPKPISNMFANRPLSRRQMLARGGGGLTVAALAAAGIPAFAQAQTPRPVPSPVTSRVLSISAGARSTSNPAAPVAPPSYS